MNDKIDFLLKLFVTIFLLFFLIFKIGLNNIYQAFLNLNVAYLLLIIPVFFIVFILGAINIIILLIPLNHNLKFPNILKYYSMSWAMGLLTPARLGEFSIIYYFNKHKIGMGQSMAAILLDKVTTTAVYLAIGLWGIILFFYKEDMRIFFIFLILYSLIFIIAIVVFISEQGRNFIKNILKHRAQKFKGFSKTVNIYLMKRMDLIIYNIILTVIKTLLMSLIAYWLFLGFGVHVSFWLVLIVSVLGSIVSFLPISISGLGVRESFVIVLYGKMGIAASAVFANYLIMNTLNYVFALLLTGIYRK